MREIGKGIVRQIDWQEVLPVVRLARVFSTTFNFRVLSLAIFGTLLTMIAGRLVNTVSQSDAPVDIRPLVQQLSPANNPVYSDISFSHEPVLYASQLVRDTVFVPWRMFSDAGMQFLTPKTLTWHERGIGFAWFLLLLFIWSIFGGLIVRIAAIRLTVDETESLSSISQFFRGRSNGFIACFCIVLFCLFGAVVPVKLLGWITIYAPGGAVWGAVLYPVALIFSLIAIVIALGLLVGWPLMFAAVAVEGADGFDAVSRAFAYVYQRPIQYVFYLLVSGFLGVCGFVVVSLFIDGTVFVASQLGQFPTAISSDLSIPGRLLTAWFALTQLIKMAFLFAWFWGASVAVYLLLRHSVDGTPYDNVYRVMPLPAMQSKETKIEIQPT